MSKQQASEWIKDAICDAGTPVSQCGFCSRTHYCFGVGVEEEEFSDYEKKRQEVPAMYVLHSNVDSLSIGQIEGTNYVWGCGCPQSELRLSMIEGFLWCHQVLIDRYYRKRIQAMKDEAAIREKMVQP